MTRPTVKQVIERLGLKPHPTEGGWFRETYRSDDLLGAGSLDARYGSPRSMSSCIYYLLTPENRSELHRLASDEVYHFCLGDPVTMLLLFSDGSSDAITLGPNISGGQRVQVGVPEGTWQGTLLDDGGEYALLGCTVAPGFEYADYESGRRAELVECWPERRVLIKRLTE